MHVQLDILLEFLCLGSNLTDTDGAVRNPLLEIAACQDFIYSIESKNALIFYCKHLCRKVPLNCGHTLRFIQRSNNPTLQWLSLAKSCLYQMCGRPCHIWTVSPFATARTFCASWNGPRSSDSLRTVPTNLKVFLRCL